MKETLENYKVTGKIKLSLLWTSRMFLDVYADYFELMPPGKLEERMQLKIPMGPVSPDLRKSTRGYCS